MNPTKNNSVAEVIAKFRRDCVEESGIMLARLQQPTDFLCDRLKDDINTLLESIAVEVDNAEIEFADHFNSGLDKAAQIIRSKITTV